MSVKTNVSGFTTADLTTSCVFANIHAEFSEGQWYINTGDKNSPYRQYFEEQDLREAAEFFTMLADELKRRG